jgi:hypothetical protein
MTSKPPWREFPTLRERLARVGPPYDELSGDHAIISAVWARLEQFGCFEPADAELVDFLSRHTTVGPDGIRYVSLPEGTTDKRTIDALVAGRQVLTRRARELMKKFGAPEELSGYEACA